MRGQEAVEITDEDYQEYLDQEEEALDADYQSVYGEDYFDEEDN